MKIEQLQIIAFNPATASEKEFSDAIYIQLESFKESNPNDPPPPEHLLRTNLEMMANHPMFDVNAHLVYGIDETLLGGLFILFPKPESPDYEKQKHMGIVSPLVLPQHRRQGIGTELLRYAVKRLRERGLTLVQSDTNRDAGRAFANSFGARVGIEGRENRLYVQDIDWGMVEEWIATGAAANSDVSVEMFEGLPSDDDIEAYSELYTEVFNQQPFEDAEGLEMTWTPERLREFHARMTKMGSTDYVMFSREPDGTLSGLTELNYNPERSHRIGQGLTGVREQYRGRGLGKWLKAKMLLFMRDNFPDVEHISTNNATSNAAMLSINARLGFKPYKHETLYKMPVDELAEKLGV